MGIKLDSQREWRNKKTPTISAIQFYHWVPRVLVIDESSGREVKESKSLDEFLKEVDQWDLIKDWVFEGKKS
jgi:hypothetical protein